MVRKDARIMQGIFQAIRQRGVKSRAERYYLNLVRSAQSGVPTIDEAKREYEALVRSRSYLGD